MLGLLRRLIASVPILAVLTTLTPAGQPGLEPVPQKGVLLLRNGGLLRGEITRAGDLYYVALPDGEIRIRAAEVECCCRDLEEGYRRKRGDIQLGNVHDHLRLAQWCLRHGLLGHAGRELADALEADPAHPMIGVLRRRLQTAMEPTSSEGPGVGDPPIKPRPPARPIDRPASLEELDRLVRGLPPGAVRTFTETIQPLLMNHCGTAACHGPGAESEFRLLRMPPGRPPSRRLTQRNLHAALRWIDREDPAASPLLTAPAAPHGTAKKAIFDKGQAVQYRRLLDWVGQVAPPQRPKAPETVTPKEKPPVPAMAAGLLGPGSPLPKTPGPSSRQPAAKPGPPAGAESGGQRPPGIGSSVKRGAALPLFVPVDPFDPEIFNRRYFGKSEQRSRPDESD